jgi:hypothetical protein
MVKYMIVRVDEDLVMHLAKLLERESGHIVAVHRTAPFSKRGITMTKGESLTGSLCSYPECGHPWDEHEDGFCAGCENENQHSMEDHDFV